MNKGAYALRWYYSPPKKKISLTTLSPCARPLPKKPGAWIEQKCCLLQHKSHIGPQKCSPSQGIEPLWMLRMQSLAMIWEMEVATASGIEPPWMLRMLVSWWSGRWKWRQFQGSNHHLSSSSPLLLLCSPLLLLSSTPSLLSPHFLLLSPLFLFLSPLPLLSSPSPLLSSPLLKTGGLGEGGV